MTNFLPENRKC